MGKVRIQLAPEIEFKMELEVPEVESGTRDYDVQQHKTDVYAEFERRLKAAFPEGYRMHTFEFGLDTGWHEELSES
ncbi:hypothetical protein [Sedimenticola selenatireducens]|uniref:Uncharacterized protein n=1 Tax=Sedimenticola selenatireducens TaxID=191960 RepID=A0A2N6CU83_9GAMM|nr:hypothetical protein [Sedimenticola selenatireducens]PLX60726.1 MAG: hypothetical protein C0630_14940 [Sedimenticola selenatireducens]